MTLRELIESASRHTESIFDPTRTMMMHHTCERADGGIAMYFCPVSSVDEEIMFREILPLTFRSQFVRWVFVSEAWMADEMKAGDPLPASHPRRIEIICFAGREANGGMLTAHRQIYRPAIGGARLLPLVFEKRDPEFMMESRR